MAGLFGTTLAPIAGHFGWLPGILAGFIHSALVLQTGGPVAGLNLYNNGFSGGLIAIVLYPTITAVQAASAVLAAGCFVMLLVSKTKKKEN